MTSEDSTRPRFLLLGSSGQVGWELRGVLEQIGTVHAPAHAELDLTNGEALRRAVHEMQPDAVINAAAYTNVEGAERDGAVSTLINALAPGILAAAAREVGALIVHYSTDYVFDGKEERALTEQDPTGPLNVYGATKLAGECAVLDSGAKHVIVRTSWVYGARGTNFMRTILRRAREMEELRVVSDQIGTPTWSGRVAMATRHILDAFLSPIASDADRKALAGVWHVTSAGQASWYEFARAILANDPHAEEQLFKVIVPVASTDFPTVARRPKHSVLDTSRFRTRFGDILPPWQDDLRAVMKSAEPAH